MSALTPDMVDSLMADAANIGLLLVGLPDGAADFDAIAAEVSNSLRGRGLTASAATAITAAFVRCVKQVRTGIEPGEH
jgi:hypothetical protein